MPVCKLAIPYAFLFSSGCNSKSLFINNAASKNLSNVFRFYSCGLQIIRNSLKLKI